MSVPYFYKNNNSSFISIEGEDSSQFLQNLITNDINECKDDNILYSCLLTPQGKFLSDFFIFKIDKKFILETHYLFLENLLKKLKIYKLRSNIQINPINGIYSFIFFGNLFKDKCTLKINSDPRNRNIGNKLIHLSESPKMLNNCNEIYEDDYHEILIKNLVPLSHYDLDENKSLLLENNFENLNSISWDKGCYIGQEITARMKYRALIKKQIYSLKILSGEINIGEDIVLNEVIIGKVVSKVNQYILCMLKIELVKEKSKNKEKIEVNNSTILQYL